MLNESILSMVTKAARSVATFVDVDDAPFEVYEEFRLEFESENTDEKELIENEDMTREIDHSCTCVCGAKRERDPEGSLKREATTPRKSKQIAIRKLQRLVEESKFVFPFEEPLKNRPIKSQLTKRAPLVVSTATTKKGSNEPDARTQTKPKKQNTSRILIRPSMEHSDNVLEKYSTNKRKTSIETQDESEDYNFTNSLSGGVDLVNYSSLLSRSPPIKDEVFLL